MINWLLLCLPPGSRGLGDLGIEATLVLLAFVHKSSLDSLNQGSFSASDAGAEGLITHEKGSPQGASFWELILLNQGLVGDEDPVLIGVEPFARHKGDATESKLNVLVANSFFDALLGMSIEGSYPDVQLIDV